MNIITTDPKICNGKPVVEGTRVPVTVILDQFAGGCNMDDVQKKYPELTKTQIVAALNYCHALIEHSDFELVNA